MNYHTPPDDVLGFNLCGFSIWAGCGNRGSRVRLTSCENVFDLLYNQRCEAVQVFLFFIIFEAHDIYFFSLTCPFPFNRFLLFFGFF